MYNKLIINSIQNLVRMLPLYRIKIFFEEIVIYTESKYLHNLIFFMKYHCFFQYKVLTCISGTDYPENKFRFEVSYELLSLTFNNRIRIKVFSI